MACSNLYYHMCINWGAESFLNWQVPTVGQALAKLFSADFERDCGVSVNNHLAHRQRNKSCLDNRNLSNRLACPQMCYLPASRTLAFK